MKQGLLLLSVLPMEPSTDEHDTVCVYLIRVLSVAGCMGMTAFW